MRFARSLRLLCSSTRLKDQSLGLLSTEAKRTFPNELPLQELVNALPRGVLGSIIKARGSDFGKGGLGWIRV